MGAEARGRRRGGRARLAVGPILAQRGLTLAVAESCTGGLLGARLTAVPGSSRYFRGGIIAYDNAVKTRLLGVPAALLATHGAVSAPVAAAMARGAAAALGADIAVGITGVAGPGGGSPEKPVGLVYIAVCRGRRTAARRLLAAAGRARVRSAAVEAALDLLGDCLQEWRHMQARL